MLPRCLHDNGNLSHASISTLARLAQVCEGLSSRPLICADKVGHTYLVAVYCKLAGPSNPKTPNHVRTWDDVDV
jgi:hypothetical protein